MTTTSDTTTEAAPSGAPLFYTRPVPLQADVHADLRVLRRTLVHPDGTAVALIDETAAVTPVDIAALPRPADPVIVTPSSPLSDEALREALRRETDVGRTFTLGQIRNIPEVRALVAPVDIQAITFDTGSAAIDQKIGMCRCEKTTDLWRRTCSTSPMGKRK